MFAHKLFIHAFSHKYCILPLFMTGAGWWPWPRSGKITHVSRISNSVTHLRSYTNTTIARNYELGGDITELSDYIAASSADVTASNWECSSISWCFSMFYQCLMMFLNVSWCLTSGSWCLTSGSRCLTSGSWCLTSGSWCLTSGSWCFTLYFFNEIIEYNITNEKPAQ